MISKSQRYNALAALGSFLTDPESAPELESWANQAYFKNNWFTPENVLFSLKAIGDTLLQPQALRNWAESYDPAGIRQKVGVVMAGNIPAVGFHDALCVLISGHHLMVRPSSDDYVLIRLLLDKLCQIEPAFRECIVFVERINEAEAYVATGSDNTARYFEYYFARKPHVIRKNRTSVAVLTGEESPDQLAAFGEDIFRYFGLGCRNVSKVWVPSGYGFSALYEALEPYRARMADHHKYFNNYEYNKSVLLVNGAAHFDNGFLLIQKNESLVSPLSVLYYDEYVSREEVSEALTRTPDKIQCVVSAPGTGIPGVPFGQSQRPGLYDYADGVDLMRFLSKLG